MVNIKGHEFKEITIRDSYNRRALQYKNQIISFFKVLDLTEDDVEVPLENIAFRKEQASVSWWIWDYHLFYSYNGSGKFVENLAMVAKVVEHFIHELVEDEITLEEFVKLFSEEKDVIKRRQEAREILGVDKESIDFEEIDRNYKKISRETHPDMPSGDTERFKKINNAHKLLKRNCAKFSNQ